MLIQMDEHIIRQVSQLRHSISENHVPAVVRAPITEFAIKTGLALSE